MNESGMGMSLKRRTRTPGDTLEEYVKQIGKNLRLVAIGMTKGEKESGLSFLERTPGAHEPVLITHGY